ncbi:MAG: MutS-related protein [Cellulosilyticaceae bacterium]
MEKIFRRRIEKSEEQFKIYHKKYTIIANIRLLVLMVGIGMGYILSKGTYQLASGAGVILSVGCFCWLLKKHQNIKEQMDYYEGLKQINEKYLMRMTEEWKTFEDTGEEMLDLEHPYAYDLDILGPSSLFQKINTTHTWHGRMALKDALLKSSYTEEVLGERQKAIQELMGDLDVCQELEGIVGKRKEVKSNPTRLLAYAKETTHFLGNNSIEKIIYGVPYVLVGVLVIGYIANIGWLSVLGISGMILNYLVQVILLGKISETKGMLSAMLYDMAIYKHIIEKLYKKQFKSDYLQERVEILRTEDSDARKAMKALESLVNAANFAYQPIVAIPLNAVWLWDLKIIFKLEKWRKAYGNHLESWLQAIGEIESMVSLSVLGHFEEVSFPIITETGKYVEAQKLGHPLIPRDKRVCNNFNLDNEVFVITGSNMSGKTTFLRTMGVNMVLAYAGAPVVAKYMGCSRLELCTSMRIRDDLANGISTFYAELTRIKMIVEKARNSEQVFFLIDEIFRGTNSVDRIIGAKSVVKGALKEGAIGAITTHDLELCALESEGTISNYHFTESYKDKEILFDYTLKEGPSTTTNARYLMKMVGIELIE